jgi:hypothetical protein
MEARRGGAAIAVSPGKKLKELTEKGAERRPRMERRRLGGHRVDAAAASRCARLGRRDAGAPWALSSEPHLAALVWAALHGFKS